jgi:2-methylcitrate dehydratase PrpD
VVPRRLSSCALICAGRRSFFYKILTGTKEEIIIANNTDIVSKLLLTQSTEAEREQLFPIARRALIDYLGCYSLALNEKAVINLAKTLQINQTTSDLEANRPASQLALFNGFTAHYLDIDDVQANFRGHPSAVIYSALLAISDSSDKISDLLWAYVQGVELAGKLGRILNPVHAGNGWHSTGTIGTIAAAAAVGVYKKVDVKKLSQIISLATTQASGQIAQEGSDGKPLNAGFAARNAVTAYELIETGLTANDDPFDSVNGWTAVITDEYFVINDLIDDWLKPAEILNPGLWFKERPICSAALSGYNAAKKAWQAGVRFSECDQIICHYPRSGDLALKQTNPQSGMAGKFSIEYIVWLVLNRGDVENSDFFNRPVDERFTESVGKIKRVHDLQVSDRNKRPIEIEIVQGNEHQFFKVEIPHGSPEDPLTDHEIVKKAVAGLGGPIIEILSKLTDTKGYLQELGNLWQIDLRRFS